MSRSSTLGIILLALGALLLFLGWRASTAPVDQISEALTGRFSNNTMWYLLAGAGGMVAGVALVMRGARR